MARVSTFETLTQMKWLHSFFVLIFICVSLGQEHFLTEGMSVTVNTFEAVLYSPYKDECIYNYKVYHARYLDIEFNGRIVSLWSMSAGLNLLHS